jgi:hypothetical protein
MKSYTVVIRERVWVQTKVEVEAESAEEAADQALDVYGAGPIDLAASEIDWDSAHDASVEAVVDDQTGE